VKDFNKSLLIDLNFRTELLESLNWDETQFEALLLYLQQVLIQSTLLPDDILSHIKDAYGDITHDLIKKMFLNAYIENGLYTTKDDYEH